MLFRNPMYWNEARTQIWGKSGVVLWDAEVNSETFGVALYKLKMAGYQLGLPLTKMPDDFLELMFGRKPRKRKVRK